MSLRGNRGKSGDTVANTDEQLQKAVFAGGCFWCMETPFEKLDAVADVIAGYTGGSGGNPTYKDYAEKGHVEAVQVTYDPRKAAYKELLDTFWSQIDPVDAGGQFCDRGHAYTAAIFYLTDEQKKAAEESKERLERSKKFKQPVVIKIIPAAVFYPAESYHQDYHKKSPVRYKFYRAGCGRDRRLKEIWGKVKPSKVSEN